MTAHSYLCPASLASYVTPTSPTAAPTNHLRQNLATVVFSHVNHPVHSSKRQWLFIKYEHNTLNTAMTMIQLTVLQD